MEGAMAQNAVSDMNPVERIRAAYKAMSKTQQRIADLLLERGDAVCFMSLTEFGEAAGVTSVTVVNFCKKLGYASFSDFKKELQNYIQTMISPRSVVKSNLDDYRSQSDKNLLTRAMEHEIELLSLTCQMISRENILRAVDMLHGARKIYLAGKGLSIPVAEIFLTRLDFLCKDAQILSLSNLNLLPNRLSGANEDDVFIIFSFPNYSPVLGDLAHCARHLGSKIICITDKATAPPACYADLLLLCQTSSLVYYNSMTAPVSVVTVLSSLLAVKDSDQSGLRKEKLQELSRFFE
jgi:DNA-binding MurR/RpiR family transcriptional regulator